MSESADPLFETLFRGSSSAVAIASAAPVQSIGTHSRAGNAMGRTRRALLTGASRAVLATGTKITMSQVAAYSGVAKATLYNHFRTKDAVLAALLTHEIDELVTRMESVPLARALVDTATEIANHPLVRVLSATEPATLAALARVDARIEGWRRVHVAVSAALAREELGGTSVVMRWLASYLATPASAESIIEDAQIVLAGLPARSVEAEPVPGADLASVLGVLGGPMSSQPRSA
jgi:AcrR family transcriptional regulator